MQNPRVSDSEKAVAKGVIAKLQQSVPFTQQDIVKLYTAPGTVTLRDLLKPVDQPAAGGAAAPAATALPSKDKLVAGRVYQTPRGAATWDGSKFVAQ